MFKMYASANEKNIRKDSRLPWLDMARGIAMLFIIIGHCDGLPQILRHAIFSFHVPLFFILSGYVYKKKEKSIRKDLKQLIVPYIITVCAVIIFNVWGAGRVDLDMIKNIVKTALYGYGSAYGDIGMIGALWFLPTMFIARRLMNFVFSLELKETHRFLAMLFLMVLGIRIGAVVWVPMNVDIAMVASGFMYIGYLLRNRNISLKKDIVAGCFFLWFAAVKAGEMEWSSRMYDPWMINFAGAVAGSIIILYLCQKMESITILKKSLSFVGMHTILLLCIHDLDWRLPFDVYWGFLQQFQGEKIYFFMSVLCRMGFDLLVMLICLVIYRVVKNAVFSHKKSFHKSGRIGMEQQSVWSLIREDLEAYEKIGEKGFFKVFLKQYFKTPGFKVIFYMRLCKAASGYKLLKPLYLLLRLKFRRVQVRYGIQLDYRTNIAGGFSIMHYSGIVISAEKIGRHVQLRQGTTLGNTDKGKPTIGDHVFIGANATIIGNITIGNNCTVGAGSVVTKSFEDNSIIAGNPAKVIGHNTSLQEF